MADPGKRLARHAVDAVSLVLGLFLLAVGGLFLATDLSDVDLRWTAPVVLIAIGLAGLVASVRRREPS
jgi:hypothetical protein